MELKKKRNKILSIVVTLSLVALAACSSGVRDNTSFQYDNGYDNSYNDMGYSTGMRYSYPGEVNWGAKCVPNSVPVAHGGYGNDLAMSSPVMNGYGQFGSFYGGYGAGSGNCSIPSNSIPGGMTYDKCNAAYPTPEFPESLREMCINQSLGYGGGLYNNAPTPYVQGGRYPNVPANNRTPPLPSSPTQEYAEKYPGAIDYYNQNVGLPGDQANGVTPSFEPMDDWMAPEGASLRALLQDWADKSGWRVIWNTDREYILEAGAMFRGRYSDVSSALIRAFARATPAPMGIFYKGNKVLVVHTQEAENAD